VFNSYKFRLLKQNY